MIRRFMTRLGTGRGGGGFGRVKTCLYSLLRAVFRDRCVVRRRRLVSDESGLRALRDERESRVSVSLSASRRFEKVSSTKKRKKRKEERREEHERLFLPFRRFHTPNARRRFRWFWKFFLWTGKKKWGNVVPSVSLSLSRARVRDETRRRRVATHLACRFRWNHPGRDHPPTRE